MPVEIQRQVWLCNSSLFESFVRSVSIQFASSEALDIYGDFGMFGTDVMAVRSRRAGSYCIQQLVESIGTSTLLYNSAVNHLRKLFGETENYAYCILRMELLMALHDNGSREV